jgi:hypothetical protein
VGCRVRGKMYGMGFNVRLQDSGFRVEGLEFMG